MSGAHILLCMLVLGLSVCLCPRFVPEACGSQERLWTPTQHMSVCSYTSPLPLATPVPGSMGKRILTFPQIFDGDVTVKRRWSVVPIPEVEGETVSILGIHLASVCVSQQVQIHILLGALHASWERDPVPSYLESATVSQGPWFPQLLVDISPVP